MTISNKLTIFRIILVPVFIVLMYTDLSLFATLIFVIASFTDYLDGYLARSRNEITNFGKFADPIADKILVVCALLCLLELSIIPAWTVIIIISREFIVSGLRMAAAAKNIIIAADKLGKIKTVFQMIAIILMLLGISIDWINAFNIPDLIFYLSVVFTIISGCDYIIKNKNILTEKEN